MKIFRAGDWVSALYDRYSEDTSRYWNKFFGMRLRYAGVQSILMFVQYASIFAMLVWTIQGSDLLNQVVLVSMILMQLNRPFEMIGTSLRDFIVAHGLAQPLQQELHRHAANVTRGSIVFPCAACPQVDMARLGFSYAPGDPVLLDVTARFGPGALNFIVGPSGAGKSSLLQILLRLNDRYEGSVTVAGVELAHIEGDSYLSALGYVPQEAMLMNLSIRENILFGRSFADEEVMEVLRAVQLTAKVGSLADGLDHVIGERGQLLSGGERQRLSIARALIGHPRLLLLDEASSALDEDTERSIFTALRDIARTTTVIAVTHRLAVIGADDRVLELAGAGTSPPATLLRA